MRSSCLSVKDVESAEVNIDPDGALRVSAGDVAIMFQSRAELVEFILELCNVGHEMKKEEEVKNNGTVPELQT